MDRFGIDAAIRQQLSVDNPAAALSGGTAQW
jgi:hypothetical protein